MKKTDFLRNVTIQKKAYRFFDIGLLEKKGLATDQPAAVLHPDSRGKPAAQTRRPDRHRKGCAQHRPLEKALLGARGNPLPPGPGADAGLHRGPGRGGSGGHAGCAEGPRRRPPQDQPPRAGGPDRRSLDPGGRLGDPRGPHRERRPGIPAQRRALRPAQVGAEELRQLPGGAPELRHLPPGEPGEHRPGHHDGEGERQYSRPSPTPSWVWTPTPP